MSKTVTIRVDDDVYAVLRSAATSQKRSLSNYIEYAAIAHLTDDAYVSDAEMKGILADARLMRSIRKARTEIKKGKYTVVS